MARGSKDAADKGAGQLTVADYTQRFVERTLENVLNDTGGQNEKLRNAETNFLNLIKKLQEAGHKDDIRVPLRVLRDEIGKIHFHSESSDRALKIEILFKLYDALEAGAQEDARSKDSKRAAAGLQLLEELRQRFSRLVIGDTWDAWPQLKLLALKRMHKYSMQESRTDKEAGLGAPPLTSASSGLLGMRRLSRTRSNVSSTSAGTWNATMEELGKAPGTRLLPLIRLLLVDAEGLLAAETQVKANGTLRREDSIQSKPSLDSRDSFKPALSSQPSGLSETTETARRISVLEMDDLLGLNDPPEPEKPADPFSHGNAGVAGPPTPGQYDQQSMQQGNSHFQAQQQTQPVSQYSAPVPIHNGAANQFNHQFVSQPSPHQYQASQAVNAQQADINNYPIQSDQRHPRIQIPERADSGIVSGSNPGSFNPFDLPSPTYASRVPPQADNNFADFSPVAGRPLQPPPAPMRSGSNLSPRESGHRNNGHGFAQG